MLGSKPWCAKFLWIGALLGAISIAATKPAEASTLVEAVAGGRVGEFVPEDPDVPLGDGATVNVTAKLKVTTLLGEPIVACSAIWRLVSVTVNGKKYDPAGMPADVVQEASLYGVDGLFTLGFYGAQPRGYDLDNHQYSITCDLGAMGPPDGKTVSYNVAGSPDWSDLLIDSKVIGNLPVYTERSALTDRTIPADQAKSFLRHFSEPEFPLGSHGVPRVSKYLDLIEARIHLGAIRSHIERNGKRSVDGGQGFAPSRAKQREGLRARHGSAAPDSLPNDLDGAVDKMVKAMGGTGRLVIRSNVRDDEAFIDGKSVGATGPDPHRVKAGEYTVRVEKAGRPPWQSTVQVRPGKTTRVMARLHEPSGGGGTRGDQPRGSVLFLVDTSGSMGGDKIEAARRAAIDQGRRVIDSGGEVSILAFSGSSCDAPIQARMAFTTDKGKLAHFVRSMGAGGGTPLGGALPVANREMAAHRSQSSLNQMIVVLADGSDDCGTAKANLRKLSDEGVVFRHEAIGLGVEGGSEAARQLETVANMTGGAYRSAGGASDLEKIFEKTISTMELLNMLGQFGSQNGGKPEGQREGASGASDGVKQREKILDSIEY
ncbi:VWA domain-containing protein [Thiohalorhabdus methylotrophus]|uniref:VWA domain-containing protein n=1 Tax=Thiohalorhabdus methylotrophus TaxID=3242694 RepID=A0ABV4TVD0_9GAMM